MENINPYKPLTTVSGEELLEEVTLNTEQLLTTFAQGKEISVVLETAFGTNITTQAVELLTQVLLTGDFIDRLEVEIRPGHELDGALGAYASAEETIYFSQSFLTQATVEEATEVFLEEVGHAIDDFLKEKDSSGDEGAIFASQIQGRALSEQALASLKQEDDSTTLAIDGERVVVEQAELTVINTERSLRNAIAQANKIEGEDTIIFADSLRGETITLTGGELEIRDALILEGLGQDQLTIDAGGNNRVFRIDDGDDESAIAVTISGLTISGGSVSDQGGGIWNQENLTIDSTTISGNSARLRGGGINNNGTITLTNSTVSGNSAGFGGGVENNGTLSLSNSTVSDNIAEFDGGAIENYGRATVTNSTLSGNSAGYGGGVENNGTLTISNSTVSDNATRFDGGGIKNDGTAILANSTVSGNSARFSGAIENNGTATLINSTVSDNSAVSIGGINNIGTATLANSIVANNGGEITNSQDDNSILTLEGGNLIEDENFEQVVTNNDQVTNNGTLLIEDPQLGSLQDNGGATFTQLPSTDSPASSTGNNAFLSESQLGIDFTGDGDTEDTLNTDQRGDGFPRVLGDTVDLGAVEFAQEVPPSTVRLTITPTNGNEEEQTAFTLTATASLPVNGEQRVEFSLSGDATADDFTGELPTAITIADGETTGSVALTINDDEIPEAEETATFTLANPSAGLRLGETVETSVSIADNDDPFPVQLAIEPTQGSEQAQTSFTLTATASSAVIGEQTVELNLGGQVNADDLIGNLPTRITIPDGETRGSVEVTVNDDGIDEAEETAIFSLVNTSEGITLGQTTNVSVAIADNDDATPETPGVTLDIAPAQGNEQAQTTFTLTATASAPVTGEQTVDLTLRGDANADDFAGELPSAITIADGETTGSVTVAINDDAVPETEEIATFRLVNPSDGIVLTEPVSSSVTIAADDDSLNLTVTNTNDSGEGSLRGALAQANAIASQDTITFDSSLSEATIALTSGQLEITDALILEGLGEDQLTLDARQNSRVFQIDDGDDESAIAVTISGLTISGGSVSGQGGGIWNREDLTINSSTLSGNVAADQGGGLYNLGTSTVTNSTISNNTARSNGGGIESSQTLTLSNSTVSGNSAGTSGGGLTTRGEATITESTISNNAAESGGGGIQTSETLTLSNSIVSGNSAGSEGGGIQNYDTATISNSSISNNFAESGGGGIKNYALLNLSNSTVSGNATDFYGGGLETGGIATLTNSTLSNNSAAFGGGGLYNSGIATLTNSTLSGNSASSGGGIYNDQYSASRLTLANTIIANSANGGDIFDNSAAIITEGVNLLEDSSLTGIGIINADPNLSVLQDNGGLRVGASDNEQPLLTQVPLEGSPAINAGNNDFLSESALEVDFNGDGDTSDNLNTDQRGDRFDRVVNDTVDLGALEVQAGGENGNEPPVANNDTVNTDENTVVNGNVLADNSNGADSDPDEDTLTITVVNGNSGNVGEAITLDSGASLTLNQDGTFSYNPRRQFENLNIDDTATETFSYTISDSNGGTDSATVEIIIEGINDAPEIPVISSLVLDENTSTVVTIEADDPEPDPLSFSLSGGADQALFSINATTGELSFTETPDFENPADADGDNIYEVEFTVEDGNGETTSRNLEVTIENVNEPPLFGDNPIFTVNPEQPEEFSGTVAATDPEGAGVNFRITEGNETGALAINNEGVITVADAAELPEQGIFNLSVEATDTSEEQLSSTADVTINVTAGNLDIGGNGEVDQSDALLLLGFTFGQDALIQGFADDANALQPDTVTSTVTEINNFIRDSGVNVFDIGGNDVVDQSDALLLLGNTLKQNNLIQTFADDANALQPSTVTRSLQEINQFIDINSRAA